MDVRDLKFDSESFDFAIDKGKPLGSPTSRLSSDVLCV